MPHVLFFHLFAAIFVAAALAVILARNPLYNVLALVVAIFCLSSLFILLEAYFVGVILLLVYAGAVLIFFLFVVMCLNLSSQSFTALEQSRFRLLGWLVGLSFFASFICVLRSFIASQTMEPSTL